MKRLNFDYNGNLMGVDGRTLDDYKQEDKKIIQKKQAHLRNSDNLEFLKESEKFEKEEGFWSLKEAGIELKPLKFSNNKTQEDVVKEIVDLIKKGNKIIFLHGTCGSGKSAIALNVGRVLGKSSIVVPVKNLQKQYEHDYTNRKYLIKANGEKMKIAVIMGKENHDSIIHPGISCADPNLPENIKISEKNYSQLIHYYNDNPLIKAKEDMDIQDMRRVSIAPANPYWSPILPESYSVNLSDAKKILYKGCDGRDFIFYHRKNGCSYYDQYLAYVKADSIIFNSAKYLAEMALGRKPATEVEIIDEADAFLDSLFQQEELNLTRLNSSLSSIFPAKAESVLNLGKVNELIGLEEKNKKAVGIDENKVFHISETKIKDILQKINNDVELQSEIELDELNYANKAVEIARNISNSYEDIYLTFRKDKENNLFVKLVSTNLTAKFKDLLEKGKAFVFMSGTLHSKKVLENIFGIKDYKIVEAETINFGNVEIVRTGKEFDCRYANFSSNEHSREDYLRALSSCINKAKKPFLVHVNAFSDLPSSEEALKFNLDIMTAEDLMRTQEEDKTGKKIHEFKQGIKQELFTTKCSRGVDFPGNMCNSIIFTKYPNSNVKDTFWKILEKTHPEFYWDFYKDKSRREFLQRIYRAVRSQNDHVFILSPDIRVLDAVRELQLKMAQHQFS